MDTTLCWMFGYRGELTVKQARDAMAQVFGQELVDERHIEMTSPLCKEQP